VHATAFPAEPPARPAASAAPREAHSAARFLEQEARAMLTRLARVKPFALLMPSVPAAAVTVPAQIAIENYLAAGRRELRGRLQRFLAWLRSPEGERATAAEMQRHFTFLRLRFNVILNHFDIFAEVLTQRSEHETGVFVGGLDVLAADALDLPGMTQELPPVICYLVRDPGAAIRRARTRLPGGGENPVAVIRVPRERMVGCGVASSLVHEVGHQGAALLGLVDSLRPMLQERERAEGAARLAWLMWERWISEIVADLWSVSRVGISATLGLIGVVSLPRGFVFRINPEDPHPAPWIRVKLSCAMGEALYPDPQWDRLAALWGALYPVSAASPEARRLFALLEHTMDDFVATMLAHRPESLGGHSLRDVMTSPERQPARLAVLFRAWRRAPMAMRDNPPTVVLAAIGQARADGAVSPEEESPMLADLLTYWALRSTLDVAEVCATTRPRLRPRWRRLTNPTPAAPAPA
jgi:hypothetical protein